MSIIQNGIWMSIIGILVVFFSLVFLWFSLSLITKILSLQLKGRLAKKGKDIEEVEKTLDMSGETSAAIAMALHLYMEEAHDDEHAILTIKRYSRNYSPWSSKIYSVLGFNKKFHRKAS